MRSPGNHRPSCFEFRVVNFTDWFATNANESNQCYYIKPKAWGEEMDSYISQG